VAEVELDGEAGAPAGVRIRLAADADPERVGLEVQRVLAEHGMRSRVDDSAVSPPPLPLVTPGMAPAEGPAPEVEAPLVEEAPTAGEVVAPETPAPAQEAARPAAPPAVLDWVRVDEKATGVEVTVAAADGRQATRGGAATEAGLAAAVIEAVGLVLVGAPPRVIAIEWAAANGSQVVTVVLEAPGGAKGAGAGMVRASRAFAVARGAWSALTP
jgi:hypothetical protein